MLIPSITGSPFRSYHVKCRCGTHAASMSPLSGPFNCHAHCWTYCLQPSDLMLVRVYKEIRRPSHFRLAFVFIITYHVLMPFRSIFQKIPKDLHLKGSCLDFWGSVKMFRSWMQTVKVKEIAEEHHSQSDLLLWVKYWYKYHSFQLAEQFLPGRATKSKIKPGRKDPLQDDTGLW